MCPSWQVKVYSSGYDDPALHGINAPRPWDLIEMIRRHCSPGCAVLDVGCGTGRKILPLSKDVGELWGLEPSDEMREEGLRAAAENGITNFQMVAGTADALPFPDERFDVVVSVMAPHSASELKRVLRPGGIAILEKIAEADKLNIKMLFGEDEDGPRGQFIVPKGEREREFRDDLSPFFDVIEVRNGKWRTVFSMEGLIKLLQETITVRNFDLETDAEVLRRIEKEHSSPEGIETTQHRLLFIARRLP